MRQAIGVWCLEYRIFFNFFLAPLSHADKTSEIQALKQQVQTLQETVQQLQRPSKPCSKRLGTPRGLHH